MKKKKTDNYLHLFYNLVCIEWIHEIFIFYSSYFHVLENLNYNNLRKHIRCCLYYYCSFTANSSIGINLQTFIKTTCNSYDNILYFWGLNINWI